MGFLGLGGGDKGDPAATELYRQAIELAKQRQKYYEGLEGPSIGEQELALETPQLLEALAEAQKLGPSAISSLEVDPRLRASILKTLEQQEKASTEGLSATDKLILEQQKQKSAAEQASRQKSVERYMKERGMESSGANIAAKMSAAQQGAGADLLANLTQAAQSQQKRDSASLQAANIANQLSNTDWQRGLTKAQAADETEKMNLQLRNAALLRQQQYADVGANTRNEQQQYNKQLLQRAYENKLGLANAKAGVDQSTMNMLATAAAGRKAVKGTPWGALAGTALGAGLGVATGQGAMGALVGAGVGSQLGGALAPGEVSYYADGGIAKPKCNLGVPNIGKAQLEQMQDEGVLGLPNSADPTLGQDFLAQTQLNKLLEEQLAKKKQEELMSVAKMASNMIGNSLAMANGGIAKASNADKAFTLQQVLSNKIVAGANPSEINYWRKMLNAVEKLPASDIGKVYPSAQALIAAKKAAKVIPGIGALAMASDAIADIGEEPNVENEVPTMWDIQKLAGKVAELERESSSKSEADYLQKYESGGISRGSSYVGDRVDAKINNGEMVLNLDEQQRMFDHLAGKTEEHPKKDIVRKATPEETNLHQKMKELDIRLKALEGLRKK